MAEGNALLKRHTVSSCIEGSNPSLSATQQQNQGLRIPTSESDRSRRSCHSLAQGFARLNSADSRSPYICVRAPSCGIAGFAHNAGLAHPSEFQIAIVGRDLNRH